MRAGSCRFGWIRRLESGGVLMFLAAWCRPLSIGLPGLGLILGLGFFQVSGNTVTGNTISGFVTETED